VSGTDLAVYIAITTDDEQHHLEVSKADGGYLVNVGERQLFVDAARCDEHGASLIIDDAVFDVAREIASAGGERYLVRGDAVGVEVVDARELRRRTVGGAAALNEGVIELRAPLPGKVVAWLVGEGDAVDASGGVVVVEAMKMENELRAPRASVVKEICVSPGDAVEGGALLCVLE